MASTKTNAELLKSIRQYNKTARETRAVKEGFATAADLILYLEGEIRQGRGNINFSKPTKPPGATTPPPSKKTVKAVVGKRKRPIIHVVDVLDSSGSMYGAKIAAAITGINMGIRGLKEDKSPVDHIYTMCDFSDDVIFRYLKLPIQAVGEFKGETRGSTALFDAIGKTIEVLKPELHLGDKVLVNIYTDGQENSSRHYNASAIATLIDALSAQGWTFTFIGTAPDVAHAQSILKVKASNTLVHDNTAESLRSAFVTNTSARSSYSAKVSAGEDVSEGFYKDIN